MGQITEITEDNIDELKGYLGEDVAENIGREYFYGLSCADPFDEPTAAIIWCVKNSDSFDDAQSELFYFSSENKEDGRELISEYSDRILEDNIVRSFFELEDVDGDDAKLLKDAGFSAKKTEGRNLYGSLKDLTKLKIILKKKTPSYVKSLGSLSQLQFRQGVTNCMFCGRVGINEDLAMLPMEWYEEEVSCCIMADDKVTGFLLIHRKPSGMLMPVLLYAGGVDARKEMLNMLCFSVNAAAAKYKPDTKILISRHDEKTRALTSYLFPGKKGCKVLSGERDEA